MMLFTDPIACSDRCFILRDILRQSKSEGVLTFVHRHSNNGDWVGAVYTDIEGFSFQDLVDDPNDIPVWAEVIRTRTYWDRLLKDDFG